jgi:hypothetical protein
MLRNATSVSSGGVAGNQLNECSCPLVGLGKGGALSTLTPTIFLIGLSFLFIEIGEPMAARDVTTIAENYSAVMAQALTDSWLIVICS